MSIHGPSKHHIHDEKWIIKVTTRSYKNNRYVKFRVHTRHVKDKYYKTEK